MGRTRSAACPRGTSASTGGRPYPYTIGLSEPRPGRTRFGPTFLPPRRSPATPPLRRSSVARKGMMDSRGSEHRRAGRPLNRPLRSVPDGADLGRPSSLPARRNGKFPEAAGADAVKGARGRVPPPSHGRAAPQRQRAEPDSVWPNAIRPYNLVAARRMALQKTIAGKEASPAAHKKNPRHPHRVMATHFRIGDVGGSLAGWDCVP